MFEKEMKIINVPIKDLVEAEYNPRQMTEKQAKDLEASVEKFGLVDPIVVNCNPARKNVIIGGHQRVKIAKRLGFSIVPVYYLDLEEKDEQELNLRLNKNLGEWDWGMLANFDIEELKIAGFENDELAFKFNIEPDEKDDEVPEINEEEIICKLGDIWRLGKHRLMCGDSIRKEDVEKLMDGKKADMVFTDPPYRMDAQGGSNQPIGRAAAKLGERIKDLCEFDPEEFLQTIPIFFKSGIMNAYIFCNKDLVPDYLTWARDTGYSFNILFWKKPHAIPLGGNHRPDVEYLLLFRKSAIWNNAVQGVSYSKSLEFGRENSTSHPTMKPVELITNELKISSNKESVVVDTFLGSGSTLIACEKTNRICYGMEIDPKYCDVIVKRWEEYTGEKAVKI